MSDLEILWNDESGWVPFNLDDVAHLPVRHSCHLFSGTRQVVAKQSGTYIVNSVDLQQKYRVQKKRCVTFQEILDRGGDRLDKKLSEVGFI